MNNIGKLLAILAVAALVPGCAVNRATAQVDATADLDKLKTVHVSKLAPDERGINNLIADKFRSRGLTVSTGPGKVEGVDAIVTYTDKWMWDITMYMLELTVTVRDPKTDFPLATGNSYHTSLTRKTPKEMVDEVVDNIYNKGKTK
ncbi:hypothetical protein DSM104443_02225 [Usitatibacter rugosus]|uniref:Uncharacterized protein n=1 Tax=Usitatibacter rugosus TaxID=2732067 RepID=A0A6M4GXP1_9PROT|nr:hypothetical protein [Usitatibacter rugosus]QJR11153.1 hypothetical protein DSM104443_02225 [Usitatibacter rugosus]